jgi:hypothetical protein
MVITTKDRQRQTDAWVLHFVARLPLETLRAQEPALYEDIVSSYRGQLNPGSSSHRIFEFLVDDNKPRNTPEDEEFYRAAIQLREQARREVGRES